MLPEVLDHRTTHILEKDRLESFKSWPFGPRSRCSPGKMAEAGFYWSGTERENDTATCFFCEKTLDGWESNDDPWSEHKKHAPQCGFVKLGLPEKDLSVGAFLDLVGKVAENILNKQHLKVKGRVVKFTEKKRDELIKSFK